MRERADQSAIADRIGTHHVSRHQHALFRDSRVEGQRGIGINRAGECDGRIHADAGAPGVPTEHGGLVFDHRDMAQIGRLRQPLGHGRRADRLVGPAAHQMRGHARPVAKTIANAAINVRARQIQHGAGYIEPHFDVGVTNGELVDPPDQPARGKDTAHGQVQHALLGALEPRKAILQRGKPGAQLGQDGPQHG